MLGTHITNCAVKMFSGREINTSPQTNSLNSDGLYVPVIKNRRKIGVFVCGHKGVCAAVKYTQAHIFSQLISLLICSVVRPN